MQSGHSEWDNKKCRDENVWSVHRMYHGQCPGHWASVGDAEDTELWSVATPFSNTRGVKLGFSACVIMTVPGVRDLVSSGLYSRDPIVTDFAFATTLVTLFGPQDSLFAVKTRENLMNILFRTDQVVPNGEKWSGTEAEDSWSSTASLWLHYCG